MADEVRQKARQRKKYADYLCATFPDADAKYVTDHFINDRRVCLYGVGVAFSHSGKGLEMDPVIPCLGPLADLVSANPKETMFRFNRNTNKWKVLRNATENKGGVRR